MVPVGKASLALPLHRPRKLPQPPTHSAPGARKQGENQHKLRAGRGGNKGKQSPGSGQPHAGTAARHLDVTLAPSPLSAMPQLPPVPLPPTSSPGPAGVLPKPASGRARGPQRAGGGRPNPHGSDIFAHSRRAGASAPSLQKVYRPNLAHGACAPRAPKVVLRWYSGDTPVSIRCG